MYFLYKYEYGVFKPVEVIIKRLRRIMEQMNQFWVYYKEMSQ
jgi:hypothetical protein